MKIAYVGYESPYDESGIGKKILSQVSIWRSLGHEVSFFILRDSIVRSDINYSCNIKLNPPTINSFLHSHSLQESLNRFSPDIIYLREMLWFPRLISCLGSAPYVVEINSDPVAEYRNKNFLKMFYCSLTSRLLLSSASGIVCVTRELSSRAPKGHNSCIVLGNGYDLSDVAQCPATSNSTPNFIFVGSAGCPWHGVDQLEELASELQDCCFHVVVPGHRSTLPNVISYGAMYGEKLHEIYNKADVGIGTLALHRKNLLEASPLKVREYVAYGLPVVLPYLDTDLSDFNFRDGVLTIPNRSGAARDSAREILKFAQFWLNERPAYLPICDQISSVSKEKKRLEFIEKVFKDGS